MNYDIFISDFDGTLVKKDGTVSETNIAQIKKYRKAGGIFAVVTGRMLTAILPRLKELGLEEGVVAAFQGAVLADIATGRRIRESFFEEDLALRVVREMEALGLHIHIYVGDDFYANRRDGLLEAYETICRVKGIVETEPLSRKIQKEHLPVIKILAMTMPEERDGIRAALIEKFGEECFVTVSSEWLVEVMPKGHTKACAVRFLSEYYNVKRERIAAIGDEHNDLPMLLEAGGKFAVANACDALKEIATVVPSCEEDGVAYAIQMGMGETRDGF